jgi:hypothetical protein
VNELAELRQRIESETSIDELLETEILLNEYMITVTERLGATGRTVKERRKWEKTRKALVEELKDTLLWQRERKAGGK